MRHPQKKHSGINHHPRTEEQGHHSSSFTDVMADTTHAMPKYQRYFSSFIHNRTVWSIGDALSKTIARPNAILFGAVISFAVTVAVYLLSKNFGYNLSGFESIGAFLVGWIAGIIFDIFSFLIKKRK